MNIPPFFAYGFGCLTVWFFCVQYFNAPPYPIVSTQENSHNPDNLLEPVVPRLMTHRYRYQLYLLLFIGITQFLYFLLAQLLPVFVVGFCIYLASQFNTRNLEKRSQKRFKVEPAVVDLAAAPESGQGTLLPEAA